MSIEDFRDYNRQTNKNLQHTEPHFKPELPSPDTIYYKDFHFLDEPLIHRKYPLKTAESESKPAEIEAKSEIVVAIPET